MKLLALKEHYHQTKLEERRGFYYQIRALAQKLTTPTNLHRAVSLSARCAVEIGLMEPKIIGCYMHQTR